MKNFLMAILVVMLIHTLPTHAAEREFISKNQAAGKIYQDFVNSSESLLLIKEGKKSEVNERLKTLVPDNNKTVYDYFTISNMLYKADMSASKSYMEKANELSPNNPYILFELAMHEHRLGNCQAALPKYEAATTLLDKKSHTLWGYLTHCHLVLGNYAAAMESWKKVDFRNHHTGIEKSMYEIFSTKNPDSEREKHISIMHAGNADAVCELVELDRNWEIDWWNAKEEKEFLEYDIALANSLSKKDKELQNSIGLCINASSLTNKDFRKYIAESGYWEREYLLPDGTMAAYVLIRELTKREIATPAEIIDRYEQQLLKRHAADPSNKRTLDILAFLYSATGNQEKLKKIDYYGWKILGLQKYAESYIHGIPDTAPEFRETVESAALQFPNSVKIQSANLMLHHQSDRRQISLMRYVAAQFANVNDHMFGKFRLNDYMASLEYEMNASKR